MVRVGYQGKHGTFSEIAALTYFKDQKIEAEDYPNFRNILEDTEKGILDYAVLPVENTTTGIIARTYDLFDSYDIHVIGEINVPIHEDLIALPGAQIEDIREVYSHPEALSQCEEFFAKHRNMRAIPDQDTASAVRHVKDARDPSKAALGSWRAREYYGLVSLEEAIQDSAHNMTRFLVVTHKEEEVEDADKISFMIVLHHTPGSLYNALGILSRNGINILRLESRPLPDTIFEYLFYIDIEGNLHNKFVKEAMKDLKQRSVSMKIFGNYKKAGTNNAE